MLPLRGRDRTFLTAEKACPASSGAGTEKGSPLQTEGGWRGGGKGAPGRFRSPWGKGGPAPAAVEQGEIGAGWSLGQVP